MITQIYETCCVEDALLLVSLGVDHIGMVATEGSEKREGWVDTQGAREIALAVGTSARKVLIPVVNNLDELVQMAEAIKPDVLQLCMHLEHWPIENARELRRRLPGIALMETIPLAGAETRQEALNVVREYEDLVDYFLIDTIAEKGIGTTGVLNDWGVGREIVEMTRVPVILAGGLSPDNVADAIRAVQPWGVDSMSHTNLSGSRSRKDPEKVRKFVTEAHKAAAELKGEK